MSKPIKVSKQIGNQKKGYYKPPKATKIKVPRTVQTRKADRAVPGWIDNV